MGYEFIVRADRCVSGVRLKIIPPSFANLDNIYREISQYGKTFQNKKNTIPIILSTQAVLTPHLLENRSDRLIWIEIPAAFLSDSRNEQLVLNLHKNGYPLVLSGKPEWPLSSELLKSFEMSIIDIKDERRKKESAENPYAAKRILPSFQSGVGSLEEIESAFNRGSGAISGWPVKEILQKNPYLNFSPDKKNVLELLKMVEQEAAPDQMEAIVRKDPALAYRLLRYVSSGKFSLVVEVCSFRHAIRMIGLSRLKNWLQVLLNESKEDANLRPIMLTCFYRGIFLEHLLAADQSEEMRDELFLLGIFSLLDKITKKDFAALFQTIKISERVRDALDSLCSEKRSSYSMYLKILESIENGPNTDLQKHLDLCFLSPEQCNKSLLAAIFSSI